MSWVKIDDRFPEHRKVEDLSDGAFRLHVSALCWCASKETDGYITSKSARKLGSPSRIAEVVDAGLWIEVGEDYEINDYLEYNPSHDQLEAKRAAARERARKARDGVSHGVTDGETDCVSDAPNDTETDSVTDACSDACSDTTPLPRIRQPNRSEGGSARNGQKADQPDRLGSGRPRRWRRVPSDWQPNQVHRDLAARLQVDFDIELDSFRDHEFKDPKTDVDACFRTWLRNAARYGRTTGASGRGAAPLFARARRIAEEERADLLAKGEP